MGARGTGASYRVNQDAPVALGKKRHEGEYTFQRSTPGNEKGFFYEYEEEFEEE